MNAIKNKFSLSSLDRKEVISVNKFELFFLKESILTANFEHYCENIRSESQFRPIIVCIFCWLITIRWFVAAIISNPNIWILIADPFYSTGDRILFNLVLFGISLLGTLFRTLFIIG